jgi:hypothetical protein
MTVCCQTGNGVAAEKSGARRRRSFTARSSFPIARKNGSQGTKGRDAARGGSCRRFGCGVSFRRADMKCPQPVQNSPVDRPEMEYML